jgi:hypothetical protein
MQNHIWITIASAAVAAGLGFLAGRAGGVAGGGGAVSAADPTAESAGRGMGRQSGPANDPAGRAGGGIRALARLLGRSPMIAADFEVQAAAYETIRAMSPEDIRRSLGELDGLSATPQVETLLRNMLISCWGREDGDGAMEYALGIEEPMLRTMAVSGGLAAWTREEPEAAHAWYRENRKVAGGGALSAMQIDKMFFFELARRDVKQAFAALAMVDERGREFALAAMGDATMTNVEGRTEFVAGLSALEDRALADRTLRNLIGSWAFDDPQSAAEFVEQHEWSPGMERAMRERVGTAWAMDDPAAAMAWRLSHADGEDAGAIVSATFAGWVVRDPGAAGKWLREQPAGLKSDALLTGASERLRLEHDYGPAAGYAANIADPEARTRELAAIWSAWRQTEPEKCASWFASLDAATQKAIATRAGTGDLLP